MKDVLYIAILISLIIWISLMQIDIADLEKENALFHSIPRKVKEDTFGNKI